jgi:hypothetical protein
VGRATYGRERLKPRDGAPKPIGTPYWMLKSEKAKQSLQTAFPAPHEVTATMRFRTSPIAVEFDIPDEWWTFAEMDRFDRGVGRFYYYGGQPDTDRAQVVDLASVEPPIRAVGVPLFKKYKLVPVLFAFTSPECSLPPVKVARLSEPHPYRYRVTNGVHRYYASAAIGYPGVPVVIQDSD